jgi:hypothetical protein
MSGSGFSHHIQDGLERTLVRGGKRPARIADERAAEGKAAALQDAAARSGELRAESAHLIELSRALRAELAAHFERFASVQALRQQAGDEDGRERPRHRDDD